MTLEAGESRLPSVLVIRDRTSVRVFDPRSKEIPLRGLITEVLNAALVEKFPIFSASLSLEGGVRSLAEDIHLKNLPDAIGLFDVGQNEKKTREVLDFYEKMLNAVFGEGKIHDLKDREDRDVVESTVWRNLARGIAEAEGFDFFHQSVKRLTLMSDEKREHLKRAEDRMIMKPAA